jgi:hypothetical protein
MITAINTTSYYQHSVNSSLYWNGISTFAGLNNQVTSTFNNITDIVNCSAGQYVSGKVAGAWVCGTPAGGAGVNYWQASGTWMWNNATAGGQPNINLTTINATTFNQGGNKVFDISGGIGVGNISTGVFPNAEYFSTALPMSNITVSGLTSANLGSTFAINAGNVTGLSLGYNTSAQVITAINTSQTYYQISVSNVTSGTIVNSNISGTGWVNSSTGGHYNDNTKIYFGTSNNYCMYYNTTLAALVTSNVC